MSSHFGNGTVNEPVYSTSIWIIFKLFHWNLIWPKHDSVWMNPYDERIFSDIFNLIEKYSKKKRSEMNVLGYFPFGGALPVNDNNKVRTQLKCHSPDQMRNEWTVIELSNVCLVFFFRFHSVLNQPTLDILLDQEFSTKLSTFASICFFVWFNSVQNVIFIQKSQSICFCKF